MQKKDSLSPCAPRSRGTREILRKQVRSFFREVLSTRVFFYRSKLLDGLIDDRLIVSGRLREKD